MALIATIGCDHDRSDRDRADLVCDQRSVLTSFCNNASVFFGSPPHNEGLMRLRAQSVIVLKTGICQLLLGQTTCEAQ